MTLLFLRMFFVLFLGFHGLYRIVWVYPMKVVPKTVGCSMRAD